MKLKSNVKSGLRDSGNTLLDGWTPGKENALGLTINDLVKMNLRERGSENATNPLRHQDGTAVVDVTNGCP